MRRSPSSWAMPTSVLANDFVAENTSCVVFGPVPLKYHSPASLPSRTTTRQFELAPASRRPRSARASPRRARQRPARPSASARPAPAPPPGRRCRRGSARGRGRRRGRCTNGSTQSCTRGGRSATSGCTIGVRPHSCRWCQRLERLGRHPWTVQAVPTPLTRPTARGRRSCVRRSFRRGCARAATTSGAPSPIARRNLTRVSDRKAVVLLSGGLDSTTVLAIAQSEGFTAYALSFRYGQRHATELEAAQPHRARGGRRGARGGEDRPARVRRLGADGRHRRAEGPLGRARWATGIPITYVPARNTIFLSFALAWAEVLGASDIFVGVNALDYSGYPDCRPEYIEAFERMANLATKAGVEGTQRLHDPRAADAAHEGGHHPPRARARRRLRASRRAATTRTPRAAPAARATPACCGCEGFAEAGVPDPAAYQPDAAVAPMTYTVKEIFYTLQGEGAQRRAARGLLPLLRLQPLERAREGSRDGGVHVLRHRLRRHRRPDGGKFRSAGELADAVAGDWPRVNGRSRPLVVCTGGEPLLQLDAPLVDAFHAARLRDRGRDQRHARAAARDRLDLRQPEGRLRDRAAARQRAQARLPAGRSPSPSASPTPTSSTSTSSPWTAPSSSANTPLAIAYCLAHPQWRLSLQTHKIVGIR